MERFVSTFKKFSSPQQDGYSLLGRLEGHTKAINCLAFTRDGSLLASGGDDQRARIWDTETLVCLQVISDPAQKWGQITCVNWLAGSKERDGSALCLGTGRGLTVVFRRTGTMTEMAEASATRAFLSGDPVEAMAFDSESKRLLVASHYGTIKMYSIEPNDNLTVVWESMTMLKHEVPRAIIFIDKGREAIIFGIEEGSIVCFDAQSGTKKWDKTLNSPLLNVALCPQERYLAFDNGTEGFDIYSLQRMAPIRQFPVPPGRLPVYYIRGIAFGENARIIVCGTDHGSILIFDVKSMKQVDTLIHESGRLIQAIDTTSVPRKHLIATSISEGRSDICIWVKPDGNSRTRLINPWRISCASIINIFLVVVLLWATSDSWLRMIKQAASSAVNHVLNTFPNSHSTVNQNAPPMPVRVDDPGPALVDAETLLQLLRQVQMREQPKSVYADTGGPMNVGPTITHQREGAKDAPVESVSGTSQIIEQRAATLSEIDVTDGKDSLDAVTLPQTQHQIQQILAPKDDVDPKLINVDPTAVGTGKAPKRKKVVTLYVDDA